MAVLLVSREYILSHKIASVCESFHERTGGYLEIKKNNFNGIRQVDLSGISILSPGHDTVLTINSVGVTISLLKLIRFKPALSKLEATGIDLNLVTVNDTSRFAFLMKTKTRKTAEPIQSEKNYAAAISNAWNKLMDVADVNLLLQNLQIHFEKNEYVRNLYIPSIAGNNGKLNFDVENHDKLRVDKWRVAASITDEDSRINFNVSCLNKSAGSWIPFFDRDEKPKIAFHNFSASLQKDQTDDVSFHFVSSIDSLQLDYWRVASETLVLPLLSQDLRIKAGKTSIEIDSTSSVKLNLLTIKTFAKVDKGKSGNYSLAISFNQPSQEVFSSLTKAIFNLFEGIQTKGELNYHLNFSIDMDNPDDLVFDSELKGKNFSIVKYGKENFARINNSFLFDAYDGERYVKSFSVGTDNPDFVPLDQVSHYLQYAVLTSEDPSFFYHRGFIEQSFRESLIENIKAKRFVRGGSTISMQLVKNVFLTREKTISRKLQEAMVVWLIENQRLVSKERMFEIYLNAIEWGPNIYGIKDASRFYFDKTPLQLSLAESIYLSSIIPHPKYYKYSFDKTGTLRPFLTGYYKLISNRMLSKTWITPLDTFNLKPEIQLKGEALRFIVPADTLPMDSIPEEINQDFFN